MSTTYLQLTAHLDIFNDRLLHGFTFAEKRLHGNADAFLDGRRPGDPLYLAVASWLQLMRNGMPARKAIGDVSRLRGQE